MEQVQLDRYALEGVLGSGSDYEVHAARDTQTGSRVVLKRPNPDYIARKLHHGVDRLSEQLIDVHRSMGDSPEHVAKMVGYTDLTRHDSYFGDSSTESYRVLVNERAPGLPLVGDIRDKFKGVPVGLAHNLFGLFPVVPHPLQGYFGIQQQIMDVEEAFYGSGYLLLDLRPQNVYFDPRDGRITVIDIGTIPSQGPAFQGGVSLGGQTTDIHNFFAEVFKFYATPDDPPSDAAAYGEPAGMRSVPNFDQQMAMLIDGFSATRDQRLKEASVAMLEKIRKRSYGSFAEFRGDFGQYLGLLEERLRDHAGSDGTVVGWRGAMELLSDEHWKRYLFDPAVDLRGYAVSP